MVSPLPAISSGPIRGHRVQPFRQRLAWLLIAGLAMLSTGCSSGQKSVAELIPDLKSASAGVREDALKAVELRGPEAAEAVPAIAGCLQDSVRDVRYRAAKVLSKIGADATAVPALATALKDADGEVRYYAAKSLSVIGPAAEAAVPSLVEALEDKENKRLFHYVIKSLRKIGAKAMPAVPALKGFAQYPDEEICKDAAAAVESIESDRA